MVVFLCTYESVSLNFVPRNEIAVLHFLSLLDIIKSFFLVIVAIYFYQQCVGH
jgi:hypothetical protein